MELKNIFFVFVIFLETVFSYKNNCFQNNFQENFITTNKLNSSNKLVSLKEQNNKSIKVNTFVFHGLLNVSKEEVLSYIKIKEGRLYTQKDIKNCIMDLLNSNKFEYVEIKQFKDKLIFELKEFSILKKIQIEGNNNINEDFIKDLLKSSNIEVDKQIRINDTVNFKKKLLNIYHNISRPNAEIEIFLTYEKHHFSTFKIVIKEGSAVIFKTVCIVGNEYFSEFELEGIFSVNRGYINNSNLFEKQYNKRDLDRDIENLKQFYLSKGFLNFKILGVYYDHANNVEDYYVTIEIEEGERYKLSNIFFNETEPNILISKDFTKNLKLNNIYDANKVLSVEEDIRNFLNNIGYLNPHISIIPELNHLNHTVDLRFQIDKGQLFFVNKIFFEGNDEIPSEFLRNLVPQEEGVIFNSIKISQGLKNLKSTNYLNEVRVLLLKVDDSLNLVNVIFKVSEKKSQQLGLNVGYSENNGVSLKGEFEKQHFIDTESSLYFSENIFLDKNLLNLKYKKNDFNISGEEYDINFFCSSNFKKNIFFLDEKEDFSTDFFSKIYNIFKINHWVKNFFNSNLNIYGIEGNFKKLINSENYLGINIGYNFRKSLNLFNLYKKKKILLLNNNYINSSNVTNDVYMEFLWNYCSVQYKNLQPIKGNKTVLSTKTVLPDLNKFYYIFCLDSNGYFPIDKLKKFILTGNTYFSCIESFFDNVVPENEYFFMNSKKNIKGFNNIKIGPKIILKKNFKQDDNIFYSKEDRIFVSNIGGNAISVSNLELIFPFFEFLYPKLQDISKTSFFFNFGNIWRDDTTKNSYINSNFCYENSNILYSSYGIYMSIKSPFGTLGISYAFPVGNNFSKDILEPFQFNFKL